MPSGNDLTQPRQPVCLIPALDSLNGAMLVAARWKTNEERLSSHLAIKAHLLLPLGRWKDEGMLLTWQWPLTETPHTHFVDSLQHTFTC